MFLLIQTKILPIPLGELEYLRNKILEICPDSDIISRSVFSEVEFQFEQLDSKEKVDRPSRINSCLFGLNI
jgi:predicted Co/Zn/Cd cation transporter (cation efflux family)